MNLVIFSGNLAKDAKVVTTSTGKQFCVTTLALREDLRPEDRPAVFVDIIIWGERAEKLAKYLTKGKAISVTGRLELVKTQKNNSVYVTPRVVVSTLEFLSRKNIESVSTQQESTLPADEENIPNDEEIPF
ncbi:MAG: single-stranded DNA-binding protein [Endomicrobia bacterium]|nr:single-stranded DNA-binding protein [Endomicrobiia bacterium]MCX7940834.1 single-stranded DNA-binding protein [Endomicrobiia bacterium]MDW8055516.1 single-stranded DNA-binding protein [Elusimicrobiota bacterium]